ncbi:unnamed protein product [Mytilus coruscus]|uniref:Mab-21-like nucleotidyltransferase domain-containing protein n=1 Tax=Mytilus coruscus TaxID=42192 RepID=A0A6J8AIH7_MYTCO|nr:unnamed protein product [Mytilus coruscus]
MSEHMENDDCEKDKSRLSKLIDDTVSIVQSKVRDSVIDGEIERKVKAVVQQLLEYTAEKDPRFKSSEILSVGSYKEKTKILEPDEFDFLVIMDELSKPGVISIVKDDALPCYAYFEVQDEAVAYNWWCDENKILHQFQYRPNVTGVPESFCTTLLATISEVAKCQNVKLSMDNTTILAVEIEEKTDRKGLIFKSVDDTFLHQAAVRSPNFILSLVVNGHHLTVDICPAIRYNNVNEVYSIDDSYYPDLADRVIKRGTILFVNQRLGGLPNPLHRLFKITFTETENNIVQNMTKTHKHIYIFLKFFNKYFETVLYNPYPSYVLKIACIQHSLTCGRSTIAGCLKHIVEILGMCSKNEYIASPFLKTYEIRKLATAEVDENFLSILTDLTSDLAEIPCFSRSDVDKLQSYVRNNSMPTDELLSLILDKLGILPHESSKEEDVHL